MFNKCTLGLLFIIALSGCASSPDNILYSLPMTESELRKSLAGVPIYLVTQAQLEAHCPEAAVMAMYEGKKLADCAANNPRRIYISEIGNLVPASGHAASHYYDLDVRGATPEETFNHKNW